MNIFRRLFGKAILPDALARFDKMLVSLKIEGEPALFVLLAEDRTVNRLGDGSVDCTDRNMFIGRSPERLFFKFMAGIEPSIFAHKGSYDLPEKAGKVCELELIFGLRGSDASEGFQFRYGSESKGPPREICMLVRKVVALTDAWHRKQKSMAGAC